MATRACLKTANEQGSRIPPGNAPARTDWFACSGILFIVLLFFSPTVFLGEPISRICYLANWDSLFGAYASRAANPIDPSFAQLMIPYFFAAAKMLHAGQVPLWNPYNACGLPLIGDIQSSALSPLNLLLAVWPCMYVYNIGMVLTVAIAGVATYALARSLGLGWGAAMFASLSFAFCPFNLWYLELTTRGYCWHPLVCWLFVRAAKRPTLARSYLAGAACAIMILSGHPEVSFFGVVFGSLLAVLTVFFPCPASGPRDQEILGVAAGDDGHARAGTGACDAPLPGSGGEHVRAGASGASLAPRLARRFRSALAIVGIAGLSAFCLAAPVLLPFGEYLLNADCYKFDESVGGFRLPWQVLGLSLINPALGAASPYLGCLAVILLAVAFTAGSRSSRNVLVLLVVSFLVACKIWPLNAVMDHKPFSFLHSLYCVPDFLMFAALTAAFGFDELIIKGKSKQKIAWWTALLGAVAVAVIPWLLRFGQFPLSGFVIDPGVPRLNVSSHAWTRDLAIMTAVLASIAVARRFRFCPAWLAVAACITLGFVSVSQVSKLSLPVQAKFDYPTVEPLTFLQSSGERVVGMGAHLLKPNTGVVYGVSDLRAHNPLFPKRYLSFMREAGASVDAFNQTFAGELQPLVNVAAVRYVLSLLPVRGSGEKPAQLERVDLQEEGWIRFGSHVRLASAKVSRQAEHGETWGCLEFASNVSDPGRYTYSLVWLDDKDNLVWYGDQQILFDRPRDRQSRLATRTHARGFASRNRHGGERSASGVEIQESKVVHDFACPISLARVPESGLKLGLQVFDWNRSAFLRPSSASPGRHDNIFVLTRIAGTGRLPAGTQTPASKRRFDLKLETERGIRVYENKASVPRAHIVHAVRLAGSEAAALTAIKSPTFDPRIEAVLECSRNDFPLLPAPAAATKGRFQDVASIEHSGANEVVVRVQQAAPGLLVLADTFYPGWTARVDGREVSILRTNFLFRGVAVPDGSHIVEFRYCPLSFGLGVVLFVCCLAFGACLLKGAYNGREGVN